MRNLSVGVAVILLLVLTIVAGCSNHIDNNTSSDANQHNSTPTMGESPVENQSGISAASCNETGLDEVFTITRTEPPYSGRTPLVEMDITQVLEQSGPDLKIPAFVPDGFYFHYATIPGWDDEEKRTTLVFVNKSHEGYFVSLNASNQMYITFADDLDVEFREFIGREPEPVCINGTPGFYYASPDRNTLRWLDGDIERWIVGPFDAETLIGIADSMRSPSEIDQNQEIYTGYSLLLPGTFPSGMTVPGTPVRGF
jgi:hypothetical protein